MIKILLNIILILLALFACYIEDFYLLIWPPQPQKTVFISVRARQSFTYDQDKALSINRKRAYSNYVPVFDYIPLKVEESKKKLEELIVTFSQYKTQTWKRSEKLANYLQEHLGVYVSQHEVIRLLKYRDLQNLLEGIQTIQESILQNKILEDANQLGSKKSIEIHNSGSNGTAVYSIDEITTLEKARLSMQEKIKQLFWQVDDRVLDSILHIALATLLPNLTYDQAKNERRLAQIDLQFPSKIIKYKPGDVMVPFRRVLHEEDVPLLTGYQKQEHSEIFRNAPWVVFTLLFVVVFYNLFISNIVAPSSRGEPPRNILLFLLALTIFILKGCLLFTPFPIYFLPFGLLPLLVISLNHGKIIAFGTTILGALLVSLFSGRTFDIMLYFILGGLTAVFVTTRIEKRWLILGPSLIIGLINATSVTALTIDWQAALQQVETTQKMGFQSLTDFFDSSLIQHIGWAFAGGLVAGPLALLLLPLLEVSWQTASTFKLNRYTDLQRPLMKKLLTEARGTYQHSMTVAYLAQSAAEAVGANTLLLRVGTYYHDIGKMTNPGYYIENQFDGENPHDSLNPQESANLIIDHVRHGMKIGQESGLPEAVVDLILQHHGTHLIEYFYNLATKSNPKPVIQEEDFRYPGPKPQSVEAAILMIVDAVEAASRSMQDPTKKKFEKMVRLIMVKRIVDGQFSDCDLTTGDFEKIIRALVDSLEASFHSRIKYPWQEKSRPRKRITWRIGGTDEKDRAFRL